MLTSDFNYNLPQELIAQTPASPRDSSRLMVVNKSSKKIQHEHFFDIVDFLQAGDLLVWNNSKVFKARLFGQILLDEKTDDIDDEKEKTLLMPTGKILNAPKQIEIFLVRPMENKYVWKVLAKPGRKLRLGMKVKFAPDFEGEVMLKEADGTILMQFAYEDMIVREKANRYGEVPVPPYIRATPHPNLPPWGEGVANPLPAGEGGVRVAGLEERYQTVYAKSEGSVAAPTAGFHFTPELIEKLRSKGVQFAEVTLHVGLGTFLPVKSNNIEEHKMHSEWVELTAKNADLINAAKADGRRIVAVGTTTVRTLEGIVGLQRIGLQRIGLQRIGLQRIGLQRIGLQTPGATEDRRPKTEVHPHTGDINIFITPGFKFRVVDALITNFHLPESTLIMLVAAFVGDTKFVLECYKEAVKQKYRFYSFGDAMLIQ